jgi:hypothetical protein
MSTKQLTNDSTILYLILFVLYLGLDHCRQAVSIANKMAHLRATGKPRSLFPKRG